MAIQSQTGAMNGVRRPGANPSRTSQLQRPSGLQNYGNQSNDMGNQRRGGWPGSNATGRSPQGRAPPNAQAAAAAAGTAGAVAGVKAAARLTGMDQNNEVVRFMQKVGLHIYGAKLLEQGFDELDTLLSIEDEDMRALGMTEDHVLQLRHHLRDLQHNIMGSNEKRQAVVKFLEGIGLPQYAQVLLDSGFDEMDTLLLVEDADLKDLGVPRGHILKLKRRLREYELEQAAQEEVPVQYVHPPSLTHGLRTGSNHSSPTRRGPGHAGQQSHSHGNATKRGMNTVVQGGYPVQQQQQQHSHWAPTSQNDLPTEQMKSAVEHSWERVQTLGTYAVGEMLYMHLFSMRPDAMALFPSDVRRRYHDLLADGSVDEADIPDMLESPALKRLFSKVLNAVGCTVAGLHDMSKLVPMLLKLGMRHIHYGVEEEHWPVLGEALDLTLKDLLMDAYTTEVRLAWTTVYGFMSSIMIEGLRRAREEEARARAAMEEQVSLPSLPENAATGAVANSETASTHSVVAH